MKINKIKNNNFKPRRNNPSKKKNPEEIKKREMLSTDAPVPRY